MSNGIEIKNLPSATTIKQNDTMTIVQDKQNKQLSLNVFANESDLTTLTPLEARCDEVKAKIEVDEYSAEITTSQSMSEIGSDDSGANLHENVLDGAFESCVLKGHTKYRDIDTGEILENFEEGRNLELITVRMPILTTTGKNLVNKENFVTGIFHSFNLEVIPDNTRLAIDKNNAIKVEPNTTYILSCVTGYKCGVLGLNETKTSITINTGWKNTPNGYTFTTDANTHYVIFNIGKTDNSIIQLSDKDTLKLMLEKGTVATPYEPYKTSILSFNQKDDKTIVLRSLPNGVCDTLDVETGEYVQRIGEVILDGSKTMSVAYADVSDRTTLVAIMAIANMKIVGESNINDLNVDKMTSEPHSIWSKSVEGVHNKNQNIYVNIFKSRLVSNDWSGVQQWLSQNPITVQYELATPIVSTVDIQGFPHAYKNGHIQLSSGSTEPSLTPTVTYKVPVSRVGQIASNTKSNLRQTIKLDQLEILVYQSLINAEYENLLVQNSAESAASFTNLSTNDPKDELYYMLKHLIEEDQPVQNMLDKINLFYLYGLLSDEHYFDLLLGGEEDVY
jgi:hypothetical protein